MAADSHSCRTNQPGSGQYGARYTLAVCVIAFLVVLPVYLFVSIVVVAFAKSGHYAEAVAVTVVARPTGSWRIHRFRLSVGSLTA
jgi:hypothetical protein